MGGIIIKMGDSRFAFVASFHHGICSEEERRRLLEDDTS
jgi:hypothetical protein